MPRGGRRPGAGRPKGSRNRRALFDALKLGGDGAKPLDIALASMRALSAAGEHEKAAALAVRLAPYFHQRFSPTDQPARPHLEQDILPLWESRPKAQPLQPVGKKEQAQLDASTAGEGTDWGDLLKPDRPN